MANPTTKLHVVHNDKVCKPRLKFGDWIIYHTVYAGELRDHCGLIAGISWCQSVPFLPDHSGRWDGSMCGPCFVYLVHPPKEPVALFTVFDHQVFGFFSKDLAAQYTEERRQFLQHLQSNPFAR